MKASAHTMVRAKDNAKSMVRAFSPFSGAPFVERLTTTEKWIRLGTDNQWPKRFFVAVDSCGPLQQCIEIAARHVAGKRLIVKDEKGEEHAEAMAWWYNVLLDTSEEEFLQATAKDAVGMNARTWHIRYNSAFGEKKIARLDHVDNSLVRAAKLEGAKVPGYYFSPDWSKTRKAGFEPVYTPAFDYTKRAGESTQAHYTRVYKQGKFAYSEPWFTGCLAAAEVWSRIDTFNRTQIDGGFAGKIIWGTRTTKDAQQANELDKDMEEAYLGTLGDPFFHFILEPGEDPPFIYEVKEGSNAGKLDAIRESSAGVIYDTFGLARILATEQATGLSAQGDSLEKSMSKFINGLVIPLQQTHITGPLWKLMELDGITGIGSVEIEQLQLFDSKQDPELNRMAYLRSIKLNEHRERQGLEPDPVNGEKYLIEIGPTLSAPQQAPEQKDGQQEKKKVEEPKDPQDEN